MTVSLLDRTLIVPKRSITFLKAGRFKIVFTCDYFNLNVVVSGKFIIMGIGLSYHINTEFCPSLCCNCVFFANQLINETDRLNVSFQVDSTHFHVEKSITDAASASSGGTEVGVEVTYEPSRLGDTRGTLTVFSAVGGEYVFPLFGHCSPPKPQGPYSINLALLHRSHSRMYFHTQHSSPFVWTVLMSRQARVFAEKRSTMSLSALRETMVVPRPRAWEDLWSRALGVQVALEM